MLFRSKVLASFGQKVVFEDDIQSAINSLFGTTPNISTPDQTQTEPDTTTPAPNLTGDPAVDLANAISDMQKAISDGKKALANGDFTAYGKAQKDLENALDRALDAQKRLNLVSPDATNPEVTPANFVR